VGAYTLNELAARVGGRVAGEGERRISGVATPQRAGAQDICFIASRKYLSQLEGTRAGAVILREEDLPACPVDALVVRDPLLAYARIATWLSEQPPHEGGIHPSAVVSDQASIDATAWVGPNSVVEAGAVLQAGVFVGPGCVVGAQCHIGRDSRLLANVTLYPDCRIGQRVIIHAGAVIGSDGFGNANDGGRWVKIPQLGRVIIGDDVEIGANTTIDRGALDDTEIHRGVRLDNLVHVAHNCIIGEDTAAAALVGFAGSTRVGRRVTFGGHAAVNGHIEIADDSHFTGQAMVTKSVREPGVYSSGIPAEPNARWRKNIARYRQLDKLVARIQALEAALQNKKD